MDQNFELSPGFVDIHCHLLHGLDDGPATLDVSALMCAVAHRSGTAAVISTPHASHRYSYDAEKTAQNRDELQQSIAEPLRLFQGCEVEMSVENLPQVLRDPVRYTLNGSRYLLVELMRGSMPPNVEGVFERLFEQGLVPIVAHPERHAQLHLQPGRLESWVRRGCLTQVTAGALTGDRGRRIQSLASGLLREGLAHFVASDGHDPLRRPPRLLEAYRAVHRMVSPAMAEALFIHNPRAVLEDRAVFA